jgi:Flp pilus assembly protein TadB
MTLAPFDPKPSLDQELIQIYRERRRQAGVSFNLSLVIIAASAVVTVVGTIQVWNGHSQGNITAAAGVSASALCFRFAKDANDRLDKLAAELKDE